MKQILLVGVDGCMGSNEHHRLERKPLNRIPREGQSDWPNEPGGLDIQQETEHEGDR